MPAAVRPESRSHWWRGFGAWLKLEARATATFRVALLLSLLGWVVPLAFMALWNTAAANSGVMTPEQTTAYYLTQLVTTNLSLTAPIIFGLGPLVYTGQLSALLIMPLSPIWPVVAKPLVKGLIQSLPLAVVVPVMAWAMRADFVSDVRVAGAGLGLWLLGWVAATLTAAVYALLAFRVGKWNGIVGLFMGIEWVLSGLVAPSPFMPEWLRWTMRFSPLWAAQGGTGEILSGTTRLEWWMFLVVAGWIALLLPLWRWGWAKSLRRFEAVGL